MTRFIRHLVAALLCLAALPPATRGTPASPFPVLLRVQPSTTGHPTIEIRCPGWREQVWTLHLPDYMKVYGKVDRETPFTATRNTLDGSVVVSGVKVSHGRVRVTFVLTPGIDRVDIRATVSNFEKRPLDRSAFAAACLTFEGAPDFADTTGTRTLAVFGDSLMSVAGAFTTVPRSGTFALRGKSEGQLRTGSALVARSSRDAARYVAMAWSTARSVGYDRMADKNAICSNPLFGPIKPGTSKTFRGCIYFVGGTPGDVFAAFTADFPGLGYQDLLIDDTAAEEPFRTRAVTDGESVHVTVVRDTTANHPEVAFYRRVARSMPYFHSVGDADDEGMEPELVHTATFGDDTTLTWTDTDVHYGQVIEYWAVVNDFDSRACTVRVRDPRMWWGKDEVDAAIDRLAGAYGSRVRVSTHGTTVDGWPLRSIATGSTGRVFALVGGVHPGESGPEFVVPVFERLLEHDRALLDRVGVAVLPLVNADTRDRLTHGFPTYLRTNERDVDLNRNFDAEWMRADNEYGQSTTVPGSSTYRGDSAASEPETQAVVDFVDEARPAALFSLHGPGSQLLYPTTSDMALIKRCRELGAAFQAAYADGDTIPGASERSSTIPGTMSRWALQAHAIPAFDQECDGTPQCEAVTEGTATYADVEALRERNYRAVRAVLEWLAKHPQ